jgi:CheY-like chemotaxis protein
MADPRVSILVVEEDSEVLRGLSAKLDSAQFRVATAPFGPAAFEFVAENEPDFAVFDSRLWYLEGVALCRKIREHSARTRVLFLDVEEDWSLFLEPVGDDGSETRITPCMRKEVFHTIVSIASEGLVMAAGAPSFEGIDWRSSVE